MQDPERYLQAKGIELPCAVEAGRRARLEPGLRAYLNHEVYFFSDARALERFRKHPLRWCGRVTDPVSRARFKPTSRSPRTDYHGRPYFFESQLDLETFSAMPDSFASRKGM